jgi:enoyl-CoA hydratase/carnithine racemase
MQVGWPVAKELLFTGREVEAREAFQIGLLNHLVAADHLMSKAIGVGKQIAANDSRIVRGVKELMVGNVGAAWDEMFRRELEAQQGELKSAPVGEGFKDFLDRKGPKDR